MTAWVKIPEKPTVSAIKTVFASLISQLHRIDAMANVTRIRINREEMRIEVEVEERNPTCSQSTE